MKFCALLVLLFTGPAIAGQKVATVKLLRGDAKVVSGGQTQTLKKEDWVEEGAVVKTAEKSFVKLIFIDKSSMNVGPASEMKIEKFDGKEAGVIDVVKGQIRSQVTKDYLQIKDQDKSKLFMKTSNAVMGVRGTDFMITTNGKNTATVLFEGEIVFNSLPERSSTVAAAKLDDIVDRGVRIEPGEFSVVEHDRPQPTVPSAINLQQRENLEKNVNFDANDRAPSNSAESTKSVVPDGLSGDTVSNSSENLKSEVVQTVAVEPAAAAPAKTENAAGFVDGNTVKPANGSFVHLESGTIIAPPPGSVLDPNTNTFIPAPGNGGVATSGEYVPPPKVFINSEGQLFVKADGGGEMRPIPKPPVVFSHVGPKLADFGGANPPPAFITPTAPAPIVTPAAPTAVSPLENQIQNSATNGRLNIEVIK